MTRHLEKLMGWGSGLVALTTLMTVLLPGIAGADVGRIREMALELEQKLARHRFDVDARVESPNSARIYKDYDFILKKNKVDEVSSEAGSDPLAERLRLYLIEAQVNAELAPFIDDLVDFEQNGTAEFEDGALRYSDILKRISVNPDASERRKLASLLPPLIETSAVFRREIGNRRNDLYQPWGFANYADFYSQREQLDLDMISGLAEQFLSESHELYDRMFDVAAQRYLGVEGRKVRFIELPHLTQGTAFEGSFPSGERIRRLRGLFAGLGLDIQKSPILDREARPGKRLKAGAYPILLPGEVRVSLNARGAGVRDENNGVFAVGEALVFSMSQKSGLENGYLVNEAAQATMAWLPRFVLDEPGWIQKNVNAENFNAEEYVQFRAFLSLYEARMLAAMVKFEISVVRGLADPNKEFRALMKETTGARLSTNDATRSLEFLSALKATSEFYGLLVANGVRKHFRETYGDDWYADGKAGDVLNGLLKNGGALTVDEIAKACPHTANPTDYISNIEAMLQAASPE